MKKNNTLKIITGILLLVALMSGTAFAAVGQPVVAENGNGVKEESAALNKLLSGVVENVRTEKDVTSITVNDGNMGMVFNVAQNVFVIDQKTKNYLKVQDIKKGMKITAIMSKTAPTTFSIPPQTNGAIGFIINTEVGAAKISIFNDELISWDKELKLNVSKDTKIVNSKGTKQAFTADNIKFAESLVLYTIVAPSMPAQTSPDLVMILNTAEEITADKAKEEVPYESLDKAKPYVELRKEAEAKGYKVAWTSNKAPIVITKDDIKAEIQIGSDAFKFEHKTKDLKPLDMMKKLDAPAKIENGKTMVPKTFIDAL